MQPRTGYVVVGAGIAGLSAAHAILADDHGAGADAPRVTVLEAADRVGGVLHGVEVGGQVVDVGAESMLYGNDDARWLVSSLGLDDRITHPATTTHRRMGAEARAAIGITDGTLRISVGLESATDLVDDLRSALG